MNAKRVSVIYLSALAICTAVAAVFVPDIVELVILLEYLLTGAAVYFLLVRPQRAYSSRRLYRLFLRPNSEVGTIATVVIFFALLFWPFAAFICWDKIADAADDDTVSSSKEGTIAKIKSPIVTAIFGVASLGFGTLGFCERLTAWRPAAKSRYFFDNFDSNSPSTAWWLAGILFAIAVFSAAFETQD